VLLRARLLERLRASLARRVTAVVAAAGYGKSCALSMAVATLSAPFVWLRCDAGLADDPALLMAHLAYGLTGWIPDGRLSLNPAAAPEEQLAEVADALNASGTRDLVIVLDDADALADAASATLPALLAERLPADAHLALASRVRLANGLREAGVTELGEEDLALDPDEAAALLRGATPSIGGAEAERLAAETEGWITGLLLGSRAAPADRSSPLAWGPVSGYLEREVLTPLRREDREFMIHTAVLERMTPGVTESLTDREDAGLLLADLQARHAFVFREGGDPPGLRYHRLLRRLLLERLTEDEPLAVATLHRRAARGWRAAGDPLRAVPHHLAAQDGEGAADALDAVAERTMTGPSAEELAAALDRLPEDLVDQRAGLVLARAMLAIGRRPDGEAVEALHASLERLLAAGERDRAAAATFWLLRLICLADLDPARGIEVARDAVGRLGEAASLPAARIALAALYGHVGRLEEAEAELGAAERAPGRLPRVTEAYASAVRAFVVDHPQGRSEGALEILEGAIARIDRDERDDELGFLPEARAYRAIVLSHVGQHEEALAEAARLSAVAARRGLGPALAPVVAQVRIDALAALGRWSELESEVARSARAAAGRPQLAAAAHLARARLAIQRGDHPGPHVDEAARASAGASAPFERALLLSDVALCAAEAGLGDLAAGYAARAHEAGSAAAAPWVRARAAMIQAALACGDEPGRAGLREALDLTVRWRFVSLWTDREPDLALQLLPWAVAESLGPEGVAARLANACGGAVAARCADGLEGLGAAPAWRFPLGPGGAAAPARRRVVVGANRRAAQTDRAIAARQPIRLLTLGQFSAWSGEETMTPVEFPRQKARALLALLLSAPGPVLRSRLMEALWPHLAPSRAAAALNSTVHTLRHALEPDLPRGARASRITLSGNAYGLALSPDDGWDALEFLGLAGRALEIEGAGAVDLLRAAEAAYGGPYLPEWEGAEWTAARSEETALAYRSVLEALGGRLLATGHTREAIEAYRRLVALEPDHEAAHRALMGAYLEAGERGLALRQYRDCLEQLTSLGVRPSPETQELHGTLLSGEPAGVGGLVTRAARWLGPLAVVAAILVAAIDPATAAGAPDPPAGSVLVLNQSGDPVGAALGGADAVEDAVRRLHDGPLARQDDSLPWSIVVGEGTYGDVSVDEPNLTVRPSAGAAVVISGPGTSNDTAGGCLDVFRGGVLLQGLACQSPTTGGIQVTVAPGGGGVTLRGVSVTRSRTSGIAIVQADAVSIEGSTVSDSGTDGIRFQPVAGPGPYAVTESTTRGSGDDGIDVGGASQRVTLTRVVSQGNRDNGIEADAGASELAVTGASLGGNLGDGARLGGTRISLTDSQLTGNAGAGLEVLAGSGYVLRDDRFDGTNRLGDLRFSSDARTGGVYERLALGGAALTLPGEPRSVVLSAATAAQLAAGSAVPVGLLPVGAFVRLKAAPPVTESRVTLRFLLDPGELAGFRAPELGVYRDAPAARGGGWTSVAGSRVDPAGAVEAPVAETRIGGASPIRFATYGALGARIGTPILRDLVPVPGARVTGRTFTMRARVLDDGRVRPRGIALWLDGRRRGGVALRGQLAVLRVTRVTLGRHVARLLVRDAAGLRAVRQWSFTVRNGPPVILAAGAVPRAGALVRARSGGVHLSIPARDDEPVRATRVRLLVDGRRIKVKVVAGRIRAFARARAGTHRVSLVVRDRNSRIARAAWTFRVP
jgi:LuxR family maltose regulon positive regulatory protein